jgi:hypothetical protein
MRLDLAARAAGLPNLAAVKAAWRLLRTCAVAVEFCPGSRRVTLSAKLARTTLTRTETTVAGPGGALGAA